jgi:hypothetical protein
MEDTDNFLSSFTFSSDMSSSLLICLASYFLRVNSNSTRFEGIQLDSIRMNHSNSTRFDPKSNRLEFKSSNGDATQMENSCWYRSSCWYLNWILLSLPVFERPHAYAGGNTTVHRTTRLQSPRLLYLIVWIRGCLFHSKPPLSHEQLCDMVSPCSYTFLFVWRSLIMCGRLRLREIHRQSMRDEETTCALPQIRCSPHYILIQHRSSLSIRLLPLPFRTLALRSV